MPHLSSEKGIRADSERRSDAPGDSGGHSPCSAVITYHIEPLAQFVADAESIFPLHYEELALNKDRIKLDLDWTRYREIEAKGALLICTMRCHGVLVGYYTTFLIPHMHYVSSGTMAYTDMYFILPEFRTGGAGAKLFLFVEEQWKRLGVVKGYVSCKVHQDHSELFKALGWTPSDLMFVKML